MMYKANKQRYSSMTYNRCGKSGLKLSAISLGMWHNFGSGDSYDNMVDMVTTAFDNGITHFDLANNYGPYPGSAEENFGRILKNEMGAYRDEMIISTKAGYTMWDGPYGDYGSRKYLIASLDQSLQRMGLDYVDIFYHHRPDPETPMEETAAALDHIVRSGKALYVGISNYSPEQTEKMADIMQGLGTPLVIHQVCYNMLQRNLEGDLENVLNSKGMGSIAFCPLAQGLLTDKYLKGIPENSRAKKSVFLTEKAVENARLDIIAELNNIAMERGQTLAQMAVAWNLRGNLTSVLIGASNGGQIIENIKALDNLGFSADELKRIEDVLNG
ncbi:MAG: L-glyceraldehyde 3-phosphate reductase [Clostridia bacterium]|nr:L-glyceraldehyde 3-phosphate reductase [Clostridia bacterium]